MAMGVILHLLPRFVCGNMLESSFASCSRDGLNAEVKFTVTKRCLFDLYLLLSYGWSFTSTVRAQFQV